MRGSDGRSAVLWLQRMLVAIGVVCLGYYGYHTLEARNFQREQLEAFEAQLASGRPIALEGIAATSHAAAVPTPGDDVVGSGTSSPSRSAAKERSRLPDPSDDSGRRAPRRTKLAGVFALLDIPRLNLSSPVVTGDDGAVLKVAVGHLPDTPKPWEPGNSAFAAHRDGLFFPLRNIRVGDEVRVRSQFGDFVYRVRETKVVEPDDLSVLAPTEDQTLTLITCYPFNVLGSAPQRFIVHAERVDSAPGTQ